MKRTIAAILVTILASAGYIVLDKASVEKINTLESQVSAQQAVIDNLGADPLDMQVGCTLRCYPDAGATVLARTIETTTTSTTTSTTTTTTTTTATTTTTTTTAVHAQRDEPTATTGSSTTVFDPSNIAVRITKFRCVMVDKTSTGIPRYSVVLSGKVDPALAGSWVDVYFGDSSAYLGYSGGFIQSDGSFSVLTEVALANSTVITLDSIYIS